MPIIRFNLNASPTLGGVNFTTLLGQRLRLSWPQKIGLALIVLVVAFLALLALVVFAAVAVVCGAVALLYRTGKFLAGLLPGRASTLPAPIADGRRNVRVVVREVEE